MVSKTIPCSTCGGRMVSDEAHVFSAAKAIWQKKEEDEINMDLIINNI